ncbi:SDR family oxidoreductase [Nocardioides sp.]|uniref:SDR family oxidoreductase n=1 Tax=Nocardioides sp. TaxID=35761 RepID=UPI003D12D1D8
MIDFGFDFTGRHVVVTGGTRGVGLATAQAFVAAGAEVSVTGTKVLPSLYDADLSRFSFHQLQLSNSDAIDGFLERIDHVDVLVNAAAARLPGSIDQHEREFVAHSARHGFVGPVRLTNKLRHRISSSASGGGGSVIHTGASRRWLELTHSPVEAEAELIAQTRRAGATWGRLGARVNAVLDVPPPAVTPPAHQQVHMSGGSVLTRRRQQLNAAAQDVASVVMFLASSGATAITGQTIHVTGPRAGRL